MCSSLLRTFCFKFSGDWTQCLLVVDYFCGLKMFGLKIVDSRSDVLVNLCQNEGGRWYENYSIRLKCDFIRLILRCLSNANNYELLLFLSLFLQLVCMARKRSILYMQIGASNLLKRTTLYSKCAPTNCQSPSICINRFDTFGCTSSVIGLCCVCVML